MKITNIVFIIRKIRYIIEFFKKSIIFLTDHDAVLNIVKQTSLVISFTDKLNLRLIRTFEYIQRFNIIIKHKLDKQHVVSNALSRLANENDENAFESKELDALIVSSSRLNTIKLDALCIITLVEMTFVFKTNILDEYFIDFKWNKILQILFRDISIKLSFILKSDDLIYRLDEIALKHIYEFRKLCISSFVIKNIPSIAHDFKHFDFVKYYDIISFFQYIHELTKHLRQYLRHCSNCQIFQIRRHKFYDSLQLMLISNISFDIIIIDFILALSRFVSKSFDTIMFVICKLSKRIILIFEEVLYKAKDWVLTLLERLELMNWDFSKIIISNRNLKFMTKLWKTIFDWLSVNFFYSFVYHS